MSRVRKGPSLPQLWTVLLANARRTGQTRHADLFGGARLGVRVKAGWIILTLSRKGKPLGDVEEGTFRRDCSVPPDAERQPADGQRTFQADAGIKWHYVTYTWEDRPYDHSSTQEEPAPATTPGAP